MCVCVCVRACVREREGVRVGWVGVRVNVCERCVCVRVCESVQVKQSLKLCHQVARNIGPYYSMWCHEFHKNVRSALLSGRGGGGGGGAAHRE